MSERLFTYTFSRIFLLLQLLCVLNPHQTNALQLVGSEASVGFDLTPAYGTVAASFTNGSNVPLARIEGGRSWRALMCNLARNTASSRADCSKDEDTNLTSVAILADMLTSLREAAERQLQHPIAAAAASMPGPHETRLVDSLVKEAFAIAEIEYLQIVRFAVFGEPLLYPENSILAGYNIGLCHPYTSSSDCVYDGDTPALPVETYYFVGYYENEIEVMTTSEVADAYDVNPYPFVDFHLGAGSRYQNPDESYYWEQVRRFLSQPLIEFPHRKPSRVILYGDHSGEKRLNTTVTSVLKAFLTEEEMPSWVNDGLNATFVGAMGAAEFAKRKPYWDDRPLVHDLVQQKADL